MYKTDEIIHLKKHEILEWPGDYTVLKGYVACKTAEHLVYFAKQGDTIMVPEHFSQGLLQFQVKEDTTLVSLPEEKPYVMLERRNVLKNRLMASLIMRVRFFSIPAKERLYVLLFQLGREIGIEAGTDCYIPDVLTQKEIGDYISCTREYLCTVRKQLMDEGWIDKGKGWKLLGWERWKSHWGDRFLEADNVLQNSEESLWIEPELRFHAGTSQK